MTGSDGAGGYEFKTVPDEYQRATLRASWDKPFWALFLEMGLGKTKILVDNACALFERGRIASMLVVAPKGVVRNWTDREIPLHAPDRIQIHAAYWRASALKDERAAIEAVMQPDPRTLKVFVMNVDAFTTSRGREAAERFVKAHGPCFMAVDESTRIKSGQAARTKAIIKIGRLCDYRRIASGLPDPKDPLDLYSQVEFLTTRPFGFTSYYAFRARYGVVVSCTRGDGRAFKQVVGFRALPELREKLAKFSTRLTKADCLELPPKLYQRREVELTDEQRRLYEEMRRASVAELSSGELVTAPRAITKLLRLHQIVCGIVPADDEAEARRLESNRIAALLEVIEETPSKVIVWATYRWNIREVCDALAKEHGPESVAHYYGDTSDEDREQAIRRFQDPADPLRFFVANPKTGGEGLTLTEGTTVVYFSNSHDLGERAQSEDRSHRRGQRNVVTYVDLVAPGTVDEKILLALRQKINLSAEVLGDAWREWVV